MKLPIFELTIKDADADPTKVNCVAFVDRPAIERDWQFFESQQKKDQFKANPDKQIVSGYLMVAELPIYRKDEDGREYYVKFKAETIAKIVEKFFRNGWQSNVNLMHDDEAKVDGAYMFESLVIDRARGVNPPAGFEDAPDGSWFGSFKVDNPQVWQFIKEGKVKGFSVEGVFEHIQIGQEDKKKIEKDISKINHMQDFFKSILGEEAYNKMKVYFSAKFKDEKLKDGTDIKIMGESLQPNTPVVVVTDNGEAPIKDGEYELADGTKIVCKGGAIQEIKQPEAPADDKPAQNDYSAKFAELDKKIADLSAQLSAFSQVTEKLGALENAFNEFKSGFDQTSKTATDNTDKLAQLKELVGNLFSAVEKIAAAPAAQPAVVQRDTFNSNNIDDLVNKVQEWRAKHNQQN